MRPLFVTALPYLVVNQKGEGYEFAPKIFVTGDGLHVGRLLTDDFLKLVGILAVDGLLEGSATVYSRQDLDPGSLTTDTAASYIEVRLRTVNLFSMALWLIKDNAIEASDGYLQYRLPEHKSRTYVSQHSLGAYFWNAAGKRGPVSFSFEELQLASSYMDSFPKRLGLVGTTSTSPSIPVGLPRLARVWYFLENARMSSDLAVKVATYVTCLEALLTTDTSELAHKLSERLALFVGASSQEQQSIFERTKRAYGIRSKTLHGDSLSGKQWQELSTVSQDCDDFCRRALLKALSSDESAELFNGSKESLDEVMVSMLFGGAHGGR